MTNIMAWLLSINKILFLFFAFDVLITALSGNAKPISKTRFDLGL